MKYVVILPDGAHDLPLPQLGGKTPLDVARIPHMDRVAETGRLGRFVTVPEGFTPATDVGTLSLMGYDPHVFYTGRAPLEAAAKGLQVRPDQLILRCNFVEIGDGLMKDNTAGHIAQEEADALVAALNAELKDEGCDLYAGVSYRNLMLLAEAADLKFTAAPPHDIIDQPVAQHAPQGDRVERITRLMDRARNVIAGHEVNRRRRSQGKAPVTDIWLWGQGRPTVLEPFAERFGPRAAVITGVDIMRGMGRLMGMEIIEVPGATGFIDTNYVGKGEYAVRALDRLDMIIVHVEAADESAHMGKADEKVKALERIDEHIVGPLWERVTREPEWRMLVAADHPTLTSTRGHSSIPPLFAFSGTGIEAVEKARFTEAAAEAGGWWITPAHEMMRAFVGPKH
jgi:2,3-bisphosphoglycerate-independent phosphoglycerate mutase